MKLPNNQDRNWRTQSLTKPDVHNQNDGDCECGSTGGCWELEFVVPMFVGHSELIL